MKYDDDIEHIYLDDEDDAVPQKPTVHHSGKAAEGPQEYKKLRYILIGVTLVAVMLTVIRGIELVRFLCDFLAVFTVTFAAFKFYDIERFAHDYRSYDILAKRIRPWGYTYPFIELLMGLWFLLTEAPFNLVVLALIVSATALVGAWGESRSSSRFQITCLGDFIRLPLARVSLIENATIFVVAGVLLFL